MVATTTSLRGVRSVMHDNRNHCKRFGHLWRVGECIRCRISLEEELQRVLGEVMSDLVEINKLL
jgi:hypothetical protein